MTAIEQLYEVRCKPGHNIDQHLPTILRYASICNHVTEFGVEEGWSTTALLTSGAEVVSYDLHRHYNLEVLEKAIAETPGLKWQFIQANTREVTIDETDLLFVDTEHTFEQVNAELGGNIHKVRRFLIFHDTVTFPEIIPAIVDRCYGDWTLREWNVNQNGLAVFERMRGRLGR